eukprot:4276824-Pyramimonas_sp.AAC.1
MEERSTIQSDTWRSGMSGGTYLVATAELPSKSWSYQVWFRLSLGSWAKLRVGTTSKSSKVMLTRHHRLQLSCVVSLPILLVIFILRVISTTVILVAIWVSPQMQWIAIEFLRALGPTRRPGQNWWCVGSTSNCRLTRHHRHRSSYHYIGGPPLLPGAAAAPVRPRGSRAFASRRWPRWTHGKPLPTPLGRSVSDHRSRPRPRIDCPTSGSGNRPSRGPVILGKSTRERIVRTRPIRFSVRCWPIPTGGAPYGTQARVRPDRDLQRVGGHLSRGRALGAERVALRLGLRRRPQHPHGVRVRLAV